MRELSAETLKYRGIRGYIVDGGTRDSTFIRNLEWPLFFRYFSPKDVVGRWTVGSTAEHIEISGVTINTGDYVIADIDGVVIIPRDMIGNLLDRTGEVMSTESELRRMILQGMDPKEAYKKYRLF